VTATGDATIVPAPLLRAFARDVLRAVGMPGGDASLAADAMVWADLRGLDAHGVSGKLAQCVGRIRAGGTTADRPIETIAETPATVTMDAHQGWGQVAAIRAMEAAIGKARATGIGCALVGDSSSAAAMGYYPWLATEERMIGVAITNGPPLIAPWGGRSRLLGNQGHAVGCPAGRHPALLFDAATTVMSTGEMDLLHELGQQLPEGVLFGADGQPTRDAGAWKTGLLAPAGGHRGAGLALMFEILTGVLASQGRFAPDIGLPTDVDEPQGVSLFLLAIDPTISMPLEAFVERVDRLIDAIHASPPAPGVEHVVVPGERGARLAEARTRAGIPLSARRLASLRDLGGELGIAWPDGDSADPDATSGARPSASE
jgi:LDH2 family malate/lactate/ureidoglycolate dehydrogenase